MPGIPSSGGKLGNTGASGPDFSIDWNPIDWWDKWFNTVKNWIGGLGGDIASGIEAGYVAIFKDLWNVILPFAEILIGALIAMWAISIWLLSSNGGKAALNAALLLPK